MFKFTSDERGSLSIEAILAIPFVIMAFAITMVVWDAFKTMTVSQKATYAVADMLSREAEVDEDFLTTLYELHDFLSHAPLPSALRVTVVSHSVDEDTNIGTTTKQWSEGRGGLEGYTDLTPIAARIPPMHDGEWLIVVESQQNWEPFFKIGLGDYQFADVSITRPRFSPQLKWVGS